MNTETIAQHADILAGLLDEPEPKPVPTGMRFPERFRKRLAGTPYESQDGCPFGVFIIQPFRIDKTRRTRCLKVIACQAMPDQGVEWDHVSVSLANNQADTPTWTEMCLVKNLFWSPDLTVVQFHPALSDYVNTHEGCLHLWRHTTNPIQLPPKEAV